MFAGKLTASILMKSLKETGIKEMRRNELVDWFLSRFGSWDTNFCVAEIKFFASEVGIKIVR